MTDVVYKCELCEEHKTDLSLLASLDNSVKTNFPDWSREKQSDLVIMWFDKLKSKELTLLIQSFKKTNIKEINK